MAKHRGTGFATIEYPTGMNQNGDPSQAWIKVKPDGRVDVFAGTSDIGNGSKTIQSQIVAETIGVKVNMLTPAQLKEIWPLCETDGILGAIQHPDDGYIQPADLTQALAKGARDGGAQIHRKTRVTAIAETPSGEWRVTTDQGDITCEHLVTATGNFVRQTGEMLGLDIPVIPVEHQYIVTEPHPLIQERQRKGLPEMGVLRESDSSWYERIPHSVLRVIGSVGIFRRYFSFRPVASLAAVTPSTSVSRSGG